MAAGSALLVGKDWERIVAEAEKLPFLPKACPPSVWRACPPVVWRAPVK